MTCAKFRCDRPYMLWTRALQTFIEFRIRSNYRYWDGRLVTRSANVYFDLQDKCTVVLEGEVFKPPAPFQCRKIKSMMISSIFALLAFCVGNSPVTGEFPSQRPVTRSFDVFFELCPKQHYNTRSTQKKPVRQQNAWFDTKKPVAPVNKMTVVLFSECLCKKI